MNTYVVWIEMDVARIFKVQAEAPEAKIIRRHEIKHHTSRDPQNHKNCDRMFSQVADTIRDANEVFLVGPGLAKDHFRSYLDSHQLQALGEKVVGMETSDRITDAEILALSRRFFRTYDMFNHAV